MSFSIVIISSGQPSLNPRLVKEADALANAGFEVTILYAYWNDWGTKYDQQLIPTKKWKAILTGGHPTQKPVTYFISRIIHKASKFIVQKFGPIPVFAEFAVARSNYFLIKEAKKHKADLYIGHNLGALAAIAKASQKFNKKYGFDAEDLHRNEVNDDPGSFNFMIAKYIEDKYLINADYITTSSPQISETYKQFYPDKNPVTLLNVFPINNKIGKRIINIDAPIKLFWFSQTIGHNRGIEDAVKALQILNDASFELHLLGSVSIEMKTELIDQMRLTSSKLYFYEPISPDELILFASRFDVGLASENNVPLNRDICLTNKIFTYLQAGLTIIASDTTAQKYFMDENPNVGDIYQKGNAQGLGILLTKYQSNRELLFNTCAASLKLGREKLNWENESRKFLDLVQKTLNN